MVRQRVIDANVPGNRVRKCIVIIIEAAITALRICVQRNAAKVTDSDEKEKVSSEIRVAILYHLFICYYRQESRRNFVEVGDLARLPRLVMA